MPSAIPERIGIYRLEGHLGSGGMGEVYRAFDDRLQRPVAIKTIRRDAAMTPERRARLRREAQATAKLSHPAVVQVYDVVLGEESDAIVMELVAGESLDRLLVRGEIDGTRALDVARQVAAGLAAAHAEGLVHRDLKSENVMVTPTGAVKILDFGLAKDVTAEKSATLTATGALLGTCRAMSPEQVRGRPVDERSDLFSFGVLCYEMFTGRSPFRGGSLLETLDNVAERRPAAPRSLRPELPPELSALIEQLLEKDPERRPSSAEQVAGALARIADRSAGTVLAPPIAGETASPEPTSGEPEPAVQERGGLSPSPSEAPTGSLARAGVGPRWDEADGGRWRVTSGGSYASALRLPARRWWWAAAALVVLGGLAAYHQTHRRAPDISVLVERPAIAAGGDGERLELVAAGVRAAALSTLADLRGISPVEPHSETPRRLRAAAYAEAADQVLRTEILGTGGLCRIVLQRLAASGEVLASESLEVSTFPRHARDLADRLRRKLWDLFADYPPPPGSARLEVSAEGYAVFIDLRRRDDAGEPPDRADLGQLAAVLETSPQFLEGQLYAAHLASVLGDAARARGFAEAAAELAPDDPRPLFRRFRIELDSGRWDEAEAVLRELERRSPGDLLALLARAQLLKRRGRLEQALAAQRTVVELRPSWQHLYQLADIEYRLGATAEARAHLAALFDRSPENRFGFALEARLELFYGDLERAAEIYRGLIAADPGKAHSYLVNLGLAHYLLGRPAAAVASYRRALELDPRSSLAGRLLRLNLANALLATGEEAGAQTLYRELLAELEAGESGSLRANESMIRAECLARLGRGQDAVEATQRTLQDHPDDSEINYLAALVYALVGDRRHARLYAEKALAGGVQPRWFMVPSFDSLAGEPELDALLR